MYYHWDFSRSLCWWFLYCFHFHDKSFTIWKENAHDTWIIYKVVIIEFNNSTVIITVIIFRWGREEGWHFSVVIEQGWEKRPPMYTIRWCSTPYTGFLPPLNGKNVPFYVITILSGFFLSNYYNHVLQCPSVFCSHIYHHWLLNGLGGENSMS